MLPVEVKIPGGTKPFQRCLTNPWNSLKQGWVPDSLHIINATKIPRRLIYPA